MSSDEQKSETTENTVFVGGHVSPGLREQLQELALKEDRSLSSIYRRALRNELERVAKEQEA